MSRVHDALRRAEQMGPPQAAAPAASVPAAREQERQPDVLAPTSTGLGELLEKIQSVPFTPAPEALLIDSNRPQDAPSEEFRSLRTRLNHLQTLQPIRTIVITSPSPAEGKSFVAVNLALAESQLAGTRILLADFDFRRPVIHNLFQIGRSPGATDYLLGTAPLEVAIKHIEGTNLYVLPAGSSIKNPLELLNLRQVRTMLQELPKLFNWVILDSPPLLFSADANLLGTLTDGTILVLRIGQTTIDTVTRAIQSLCENNVIGTVVNGARAGELYSKYTYYYRYGYSDRDSAEASAESDSQNAG